MSDLVGVGVREVALSSPGKSAGKLAAMCCRDLSCNNNCPTTSANGPVSLNARTSPPRAGRGGGDPNRPTS
ncbi:MAG TPA: hypothetical protein VGL36_06335 [Kribbella sp.]